MYVSGTMVNIAISQQGNFVAGQEFNRAIEFAAGETTHDFSIATEDDTEDEADGSITVQLLSGQHYSIGTFTTATVPITDNDEPINGPIISIYELTKTITEGDLPPSDFYTHLHQIKT